MLWKYVPCIFHKGVSGAASIDGAYQGKCLYMIFGHSLIFNAKSILLDGGFVSIFEKLNEGDERETNIAQSMLPLLVNGNEWILNPMGTLVKMVKHH